MNKNILKNRKAILSAALVIAATASAFAQGNGIAGINEAAVMKQLYLQQNYIECIVCTLKHSTGKQK